MVSIGLARFAYTSLIQTHWFSASDVVYLGAANLVGYLIGALIGRPLARRTSNKNALRLIMLAVTLSFFACGFTLSVIWYFGWRLLSGIAGDAIMVLVAATVLPHVPSPPLAARKNVQQFVSLAPKRSTTAIRTSLKSSRKNHRQRR